jgi:formate hydrogenlyase subunit 3/multisubunit Na+/H+ antiporter MnhD subunit
VLFLPFFSISQVLAIKFILWYGYIYYIFALCGLFLWSIFLMRLVFLSLFYKFNYLSLILQNVISFFVFFALFALAIIYNLLDVYSAFSFCVLSNPLHIVFCDLISTDNFLNIYNLSTSLLTIYSFPFLYIFLIVTLISILYCLSYNTTEISAFMFYVTLILIAGYILFFTDSLILFFLSYELLLVPSFFILYNFAKTRRCVEAAYLMFFWTQFGALFLIISFLYIFFIAGTSSFESLGLLYFNPFELNFLFLC